jgi:sugar/nucleoside kinase (ribokinase family)
MTKPLVIYGASRAEVFAVSRRMKPEKHERRKLIVFEQGNDVWLDNAIVEVGGGGLIGAMVAMRQGIKPTLVSKIGNDTVGRMILASLDGDHISTEHIIQDSKHHSDMTVHLTMTGREQTLLRFNGSFLSLYSKNTVLPKVSRGYLYIATLPPELSQLKALLHWADRQHMTTIVRAHDVHLVRSHKLMDLLAQAQMVIMNRDELSLLLGGYFEAKELIARAYNVGLRNVAIFDGLEGYFVLTDTVAIEMAGNKKIKPLETTGVEESFAAMYVSALVQGQSPEQSLLLAAAQADVAMTVVGTRSALLRKPVVKARKLKQYQLQDQGSKL